MLATAAEYELAWRIAPHLTAMSEAEKDGLERRKERALRKAKSWDAAKNPPEPVPYGRLVKGRMGGRGTYWRERR